MGQEKNTYKSEEIGKNYSVFGKYISPEEIMEIIMSIKADDIINTANKIFSGTTTSAIIGRMIFRDFNDMLVWIPSRHCEQP